MSGIVPRQVAEIIVALEGAPGRRGSGYRVGSSTVLTAAHVVANAVSVRVRFDADRPGEWSTEAIPCWTDPRSDLAVLTIAPREEEPPVVVVVVVARFGRISDRPAVLAVRTVGFPRFKLKSDDDPVVLDDELSRYRDSHQADGSVAVLSNRREGTLEVTVPPPERDPDPAVSPWEGMSGAAVWIGDHIVGVIAKHHRSDGLGRLAAGRLDLALEALENLDPDRRANLRRLLSLPDMLPDVVQPSTGERTTTAYQSGSQHAVRSHRQVILSRVAIGILLVGLVVATVLTTFSGSGPPASSGEATAAAIQDVLCMQDGTSASWQNHHSKLYLAVRDNATGANVMTLDESPFLPETTFTVRRSKLQDFRSYSAGGEGWW